MSQSGPGNLLYQSSPEQLKKSDMFVGNPQIPSGVLCDSSYRSALKTAHELKAIILKIAEPCNRGVPNSPAIILKKRLWKIGQFLVRLVGSCQRLCNTRSSGAALVDCCNFPLGPFV